MRTVDRDRVHERTLMGSPLRVVITGAGSGIGQATAAAFVEKGHRVVLTGRRVDALEATAALCAFSDHVHVVAGDVANEQDVKRVFAAALTRFGGVDVLFNNAGVFGPQQPLGDVPLNDWQTTIDTNLTGAFLMAREALNVMAQNAPPGGRIINNGSLSAHAPRINGGTYAVTKAALSGLTHALALEGRACGVTASQIDVGNAATPLTQSHAGHGDVDGGTSITASEPSFGVAEVAQMVVTIASAPKDLHIYNVNMFATGMPYLGRG